MLKKMVLWGVRKRLIYLGLTVVVVLLNLWKHVGSGGEVSDFLATLVLGILIGVILYSYRIRKWLKKNLSKYRIKDDVMMALMDEVEREEGEVDDSINLFNS